MRYDSRCFRHKPALSKENFEAAVFLTFAVVVLLALAYPQTVVADPNPPAPAGIAPGTTITPQNWQRYRQFMS